MKIRVHEEDGSMDIVSDDGALVQKKVPYECVEKEKVVFLKFVPAKELTDPKGLDE